MYLVDILAKATWENRAVDWTNEVLPRVTQEAATRKTAGGLLPLHLAAAYKAPVEVVAALLKAYPEGARDRKTSTNLEVGASIECQYSSEHDLWCRGKISKDIRGNPFLSRLAFVVLYDHGGGEQLLEIDRIRLRNVELPLRYAAENHAPADVVDALLKAYPEGAGEKDEHGRLPLRYAAENHAPADVVAALLKAYPEGAGEKDEYGRLPLHYAVENQAPVEVVDALLKAYPEGAKVKDKDKEMSREEALMRDFESIGLGGLGDDIEVTFGQVTFGRLPLHFAAEKHASLEVIRILLAAYPEAVREMDKSGRLDVFKMDESGRLDVVKGEPLHTVGGEGIGRLPLHLALENNAPTEVVDALRDMMIAVAEANLQAYLDSASKREKDENGQVTLHRALFEGAPVGVINAIIQAYPEGAREIDGNGQLPLHWAFQSYNCTKLRTQNKAPLDIVDALAKAYPEGVNMGDIQGRTPAYLAAVIANPSLGDDQGKTPVYLTSYNEKEEGRENPYLDLLIDKYHAVFLSKHAAMLTEREKKMRALEFLVLAAVLGGSAWAYLVGGKNLTTTCDTFYNGMLLQPYLFDFIAVFLFKVVQFAFEEGLMPGLDFLGFATGATPALARSRKSSMAALKGFVGRYFSCCSARAKISVESCVESGPDSKQERQQGDQKQMRGSDQVTLGDVYLDSIPDAQNHSNGEQEQGITMNPLRANVGGEAEIGVDLEQGRSSLHDTRATSGDDAPPPPPPVSVFSSGALNEGADFDGKAVIAWSSQKLYDFFGETTVKAWRKKKYLSAKKTDPDYRGPDFWYQAPYLFLYLQIIASWISFIVAAVRVDASLPGWAKYTDFCAMIVNSGIPMTLFSLYKMLVLDGRRSPFEYMSELPGFSLVAYIIFVPLWLLAGPVATHILPAMVIYCWVIFVICWVSHSSASWRHELKGRNYEVLSRVFCGARANFLQYHVDLLTEVSLRFLFIFFFHVLFNWASLVYNQRAPITAQGYLDVFAQDWHLRSQSQCFFNHAHETEGGLVTLFSWF